METEIRQRVKSSPVSGIALVEEEPKGHPGGEIKHGAATQVLRFMLFITYFMSCCCSYVSRSTFPSPANWSRIVATQLFGVPLYWLNRDLYYAYMALTKQSFGIFVTTLTQWWAPTPVRVSGDASVAGQIKKTADGRVELEFPGRVVLIGNHQVWTSSGVGCKHADTELCRYTRTGFTSGGPHTPTGLKCMATYISS
jgi:lysocardiolipin and lysophospholipid acyltransferase